jgi:hypothetical protein
MVNDYPKQLRFKFVGPGARDTIAEISESTGAAITTCGRFYPPGSTPRAGTDHPARLDKLHLLVQAPDEVSLANAEGGLERIVAEVMASAK